MANKITLIIESIIQPGCKPSWNGYVGRHAAINHPDKLRCYLNKNFLSETIQARILFVAGHRGRIRPDRRKIQTPNLPQIALLTDN